MLSILPYIQIALSIILVTLVLMQQSDADLGSAFGGSTDMNRAPRTRRGAEKVIFISTIVVAVLLALSALAALVIH